MDRFSLPEGTSDRRERLQELLVHGDEGNLELVRKGDELTVVRRTVRLLDSREHLRRGYAELPTAHLSFGTIGNLQRGLEAQIPAAQAPREHVPELGAPQERGVPFRVPFQQAFGSLSALAGEPEVGEDVGVHDDHRRPAWRRTARSESVSRPPTRLRRAAARASRLSGSTFWEAVAASRTEMISLFKLRRWRRALAFNCRWSFSGRPLTVTVAIAFSVIP